MPASGTVDIYSLQLVFGEHNSARVNGQKSVKSEVIFSP
jgi:hypothetical protein